MHKSNGDAAWDAEAERTAWLNLDRREAFERIFPRRPDRDPNGFYDLCLAEQDAVRHIVEKDCFASEADLDAELRRLLEEPTVPSIPPFNLDRYEESQGMWIRSLLGEPLRPSPAEPSDREKLIAKVAFAVLALGCWFLNAAFDEDGSNWFGLSPWQAFAAFLPCVALFFLLGEKSKATGKGKAKG